MSTEQIFSNGKSAMTAAMQGLDSLVQIDDTLRIKLQTTLLSIYDDVVAVCIKHSLSCYLVGGSALGAVRHHGFIPWDDDFDIAMSRKDYQKFQKVFEQELGDRYILNAPNYSTKVCARFPKVLKKNTVFKQIGGFSDSELQGIFLDIFIIDNVPDNKLLRRIKGMYCNLLEFISGQVMIRECEDETTRKLSRELRFQMGSVQYCIRKTVGVVFSIRNSTYWFNLVDKAVRCENEQSFYCSIPTGRKHYFGEMLPREVFFPSVEGDFFGRKVLLPNMSDVYLNNLYGDYMTIPPVEKRESHWIEKISFEE